MSRSKLPKLKKAHQQIVLDATNLANKRAREILLDNPRIAQRLTNLSGKNLSALRRSWAPFRPDFGAPSGFGMTLIVDDPLVRELLEDEGLYELADQIGTQAIGASIKIHEQTFIATMLEDLIMRPASESFYTPYLEWPGERAWPGEMNDRYIGD